MKNRVECICVCESCNNDTEDKRLAYCFTCVNKAIQEGFCGNKGGPYNLLRKWTSQIKVRRRQKQGHKLDMKNLV